MSNDKMKPPSDGDIRCAHEFTKIQPGYGFNRFIRKDELERSGCIVNNVLTIRCDLDVNQFSTKKQKVKPAMASYVSVPPRNLGQQFGALLSNSVGADVTFQISGKRFMAHRCVLAARSPVFMVELYGPMEESNTERVIQIDDMEPEVFEALLGFIYTDSLPEMKKKDEMVMAQLLLGAADRYDIKRLRLMCEDKLCRNINKCTVTNMLALVDQRPSCQGLKKACFEFLLRSPKLLQEVMAMEAFNHLANELLLFKVNAHG
uniref:BTB domain-containing protein n=1 Tax=Leersia perrieri TaxID=77586 RepID=A0A0D9XJX0_9ORYZ